MNVVRIEFLGSCKIDDTGELDDRNTFYSVVISDDYEMEEVCVDRDTDLWNLMLGTDAKHIVTEIFHKYLCAEGIDIIKDAVRNGTMIYIRTLEGITLTSEDLDDHISHDN